MKNLDIISGRQRRNSELFLRTNSIREGANVNIDTLQASSPGMFDGTGGAEMHLWVARATEAFKEMDTDNR